MPSSIRTVLSLTIVALTGFAAIWPSDVSASASPRTIERCDVCETRAAARFQPTNVPVDCTAEPSPRARRRLTKALQRCHRRKACRLVADVRPLTTVDQIVAASRTSCATPDDPPVGRAPVDESPADGTGTASIGDVAAFCATQTDFTVAPPLMPLPSVDALPSWCDEEAAYQEIVAACGELPQVVVRAGAAAGGNGTVAAPFDSIAAALAACAGRCHIAVTAGTYVENVQLFACTVLEGGFEIVDGALRRGAERPRIEGQVRADGDSILLARLDVNDAYGALSTGGDVLVSDAVLRGGYEAGSSAWQALGPRICRSYLAGGYGGFDVAWQSNRLWVAGSAISACYEGVALSWGSRGLRLVDSVVFGGYAGVGTSWGSVDVDVRGNRLGSAYAAVDVHVAADLSQGEDAPVPHDFAVTVVDNHVVSGSLPEHRPEIGIVVQDNAVE